MRFAWLISLDEKPGLEFPTVGMSIIGDLASAIGLFKDKSGQEAALALFIPSAFFNLATLKALRSLYPQ